MQHDIIEEIKKIFGAHLISVLTYQKNTKWCIVVEELLFEDLVDVGDLVRKMEHTPLIVTINDLKNSTDVFPLEYLNIMHYNTLLYGKDVFKNLVIKAPDIRRQLEFEFRSKLINLRETFMQVATSKKDIDNLAKKSIDTLMPLFIGILQLKNIKIPASEAEIFTILAEKYKLNVQVLHNLYKGEKFNPLQQKNNIRDLIILLEDLIEISDGGKL